MKSCKMLLISLPVLLDDVLLDEVLLVEEDVLASANRLCSENPVLPEDELLAEETSPFSKISISKPVPLADELEDDDEPPDGGGPGGGPPAPCGPPGPPWAPGPAENVLAKMFCSSLAWLLVKAPLETWLPIRLSILDLISPGPASLSSVDVVLVPVLDEEDCPAESELSILVNADDSALWSDELTVPADTSD
jgi:hypothetical protein